MPSSISNTKLEWNITQNCFKSDRQRLLTKPVFIVKFNRTSMGLAR
jgi:hypothetical protein